MSDVQLFEHYKEANTLARHYSNLRFANLTVFLAITFGLLTVVSSKDALNWLKLGSTITGVIVAILFFTTESGINAYINHFQATAKKIEGQLDFEMWQTLLPQKSFVKATTAMRILYAVVLLFWLFGFIKMFMSLMGPQ